MTVPAFLFGSAPARAQVVLSVFGLDQHVSPPASAVQITGYLTQSATGSADGQWTITSVTISVDGQAYPATLNGGTSGSRSFSITWDSSQAGNPSEHSISATAQLTLQASGPRNGQTLTASSTAPPPPATGPYYNTTTYGDGREADFVIADIRLKSLAFTGNIGMVQNATTDLSTPELAWNPAGGSSTSSGPAAYVQGKSVGFTLTFCDSKGAALAGKATTGYTLKLQANPNATNAGTGQPIPPLTLYDNTTAIPVAPTSFTGGTASVTATTALSGYVARYTTTFTPHIYVEFTQVTPTPTWGLVGSPAAGKTLYALVATPTGVMATLWVPVLDYACRWATGSTDATSATTALTKAEYDNCTYNNGYFAHTNNPWQDGSETFHLQAMLGDMTGQYNDFADFLVCLSNAIGARPLKPQRSVTAAEYTNGSLFYTKPITAAKDETPSDAAPFPGGWAYHQWANDSNIFDGSLRFGGTTTPANLSGPALGTTYNVDLVSSYLHTPSSLDWDPQSPFVLTVVN